MNDEYYVMSQLLDGIPMRGPPKYLPLRGMAEDSLHGTVRSGPFPAFPERPWRGLPKIMEDAILQAIDLILPDISDCSIIVVRIRQSPKCRAVVKLAEAYRTRQLRHFFVLLGEEGSSCRACRAFFAEAPLVFRHYHHEDCAEYGARVLTLPMGVMTAPPLALDRSRPLSARNFVWSFASTHVTSHRSRIVEQFKQLLGELGRYALFYPGKDPQYMETLCNSKFVLCPRGNHEDTWRLHEALYCGAIAVSESAQYFEGYMPQELLQRLVLVGPFQRKSSLEVALNEIKSLLADPKALDRRQNELQTEREQYELSWKAAVRTRIHAVSHTPTLSSKANQEEL
eukprot:CAMPEP_0179011478 /NCGR_PEP_ID=MMETSP0796-20121207/685_1 /TAXON_ID=73915 /ORGANISM="Pyrodinium bahamense, Strain pbaha01" /LENGTH=340 /DNA_ID=CAMNT_0020706859 /DNA_START=85 /DNA_END=1107 /DNA_ORIENTATION=+